MKSKTLLFLFLVTASHTSSSDELEPVRIYLHKAESFVDIYVKPMADGYDVNRLNELVDEDAIERTGDLQRQSEEIIYIAHKNKDKVDSFSDCNFVLLGVYFKGVKRIFFDLSKCKSQGCPNQRPSLVRHMFQDYSDALGEELSDCKKVYSQ